MTTNDDYSHVSTDMFDGALESIVDGMTGAEILAVPGVYEVLSEALNNDVLSTFDGEREVPATPGYCTDPRHDEPCPLPCSTCADECDPPTPDVIGYHAECPACNETFNPAGPDDNTHIMRDDGTECGGVVPPEQIGWWSA